MWAVTHDDWELLTLERFWFALIRLIWKINNPCLSVLPRSIDALYSYLCRHIWETCGCLDIALVKPFFKRSMLCGHVDVYALEDPATYNLSQCFSYNHITETRCQRFLSKMFEDLLCMQRVKTEHLNQENISEFVCHCPPPCRSKYP